MSQVSKIEIPVEEATAAALADAQRREAVGRLVDRLVRPGADDPLVALFERTAATARDAGIKTMRFVAHLSPDKVILCSLSSRQKIEGL